MALGFKSKLGFVRGDFPRPSDPYELTKWERCNSVVHTWILHYVSKETATSIVHSRDSIHAWQILHNRFGGSVRPRLYALRKEINSLSQGDMSVASFHGKFLQLWSEEEALQSHEPCELGLNCKATTCVEKKMNEYKIIQFLMRLNDIHAQVRTQILTMNPLPNIDEVTTWF